MKNLNKLENSSQLLYTMSKEGVVKFLSQFYLDAV